MFSVLVVARTLGCFIIFFWEAGGGGNYFFYYDFQYDSC